MGSTWRRTSRGRSISAGCIFSSAPRSRGRSRTAAGHGCCATRPTRESRLSSGRASTPSARARRGSCGESSTAARASPVSPCVCRMARRRRAFATSRWGSRDDGGRRRRSSARGSGPMSAVELVERALSCVRTGDGALATVAAERSLLLRFARSRPTQATAVDDATISITVLCDGHVGSAATNREDEESLTACARAAEAAAESAARTRGSGSYPGFPSPAPAKPHDGFDAATAELDPAVGGRALASAFDVGAAHGAEAHGVWSVGDVETALATTTGTAVVDRVSDAFMKTTCIASDGRSGWANRTSVKATDLDATAVAEAAAKRATGAFAKRREVVKLAPGDYRVVLAPAAIAEMLDWLAMGAFNGLAHAEGRGALVGRIGTRVAAPSVNLSDSPRYLRTLPRAFDAEGVPKA